MVLIEIQRSEIPWLIGRLCRNRLPDYLLQNGRVMVFRMRLIMADMIVSGAGSTQLNGTYVFGFEVNGKPAYFMSGGELGQVIVWVITHWAIQDDEGQYYYSSDDVATPDLCITWVVDYSGILPVPTVTSEGGSSGIAIPVAQYYYARLRRN